MKSIVMTSFASLCKDTLSTISGLMRPASWQMLLSTCTYFDAHRKHLVRTTTKKHNIITEGAKCGSPTLMQYGVDLGYEIKDNTIEHVIRSGNMTCAEFLAGKLPDNGAIIRRALLCAAELGSIPMYVFIVQHSRDKWTGTYVIAELVLHKAAKNNHLAFLKHVHHLRRTPYDLTRSAAKNPDGNVILWAVNNGSSITHCVYENIIHAWQEPSSATPRSKLLKLFNMVHTIAMKDTLCHKLPAGGAYAIAYKLGAQEFLDWFSENMPTIGFDRDGATAAVKYDWQDILEKCIDIDDRYDQQLIIYAAKKDRIGMIEYFDEIGWMDPANTDLYHVMVNNASNRGHLEVIKYVHEICPHAGYTTMSNAIRNGHINVIEYIYPDGDYNFDVLTEEAVSAGQYDVVCWLKDNGILSKDTALLGAFRHGDKRMVKVIGYMPPQWTDKIYDKVVKKGTMKDSTSNYIYCLIRRFDCEDRLDAAMERLENS